MGSPATTRLSSKGQVVIPEEVRQKLRLLPGVQFLVLGEGDVVILKVISPPSITEFDGLIAEARSQARRSRLRKRDVTAAVSRARARE
jgi:AbrB family looped-hinge helix DNA binding protein